MLHQALTLSLREMKLEENIILKRHNVRLEKYEPNWPAGEDNGKG